MTNPHRKAAEHLASALARRQVLPAAGPTIAAWRREELWKVPGQAAASAADATMTGGVTYAFDDATRYGAITISEENSHDQIGFRVWDGAVLMGKYMEHAVAGGQLDFRGKRVVELGAGCGLTSMIAARLGDAGTRAVATDLPSVVGRTAEHIARNGLSASVEASPLPWGDAAAADTVQSKTDGGKFDLLLASDLAAPVAFVDPLFQTLLQLMPSNQQTHEGGRGASAQELIITCQSQREFTAPLLDRLRAAYDVVEVPAEKLHPGYRTARHTIYRVRPKMAG